MKRKELILNSIFLKNRILELGIKQWWLAEQIGVDRKTVIRWVQGQVRSIQYENAEALGQILDCKVEDLSLSDEAEQLATPADQKQAAQLLANSSLVDKLGPIGEWNVIESMLKAIIVPNLPLNVLGELYNQLTVASWRQSKISEADLYNRKAEEVALKAGDKSVLAAALLSKANIFSWRGQITKAIETYKQAILLEKFVEQKTVASAYSNFGAVLYESGDLDQGLHFQEKAIELFEIHGRPMNLSIAYCHLAMILLQKNRIESAQEACAKSATYAKQDDYRRGTQMTKLIQAEIFARQNSSEKAQSELQQGLDGFAALGIEEGLNYEYAGRILRLLGKLLEAEKYLRRGIEISKDFPMYQAALCFELSLTLSDQKKRIEAEHFAQQAIDRYQKCEAPLRIIQINNVLGPLTLT